MSPVTAFHLLTQFAQVPGIFILARHPQGGNGTVVTFEAPVWIFILQTSDIMEGKKDIVHGKDSKTLSKAGVKMQVTGKVWLPPDIDFIIHRPGTSAMPDHDQEMEMLG